MQAQNTKSSYLTVGAESTIGQPTQTSKSLARVEGSVNKTIENVNNESIQNIFNNVSYVGKGTDNTEWEVTVELSPIESPRLFYSLLGNISSADVSSEIDSSVWKHTITENLCNYKTLSLESKEGGCSTSGNGQNYLIGRAFGCTMNSMNLNFEEGFITMKPNRIAYGKFDVAFLVANESEEATSTSISNITHTGTTATVTSTAHGLSVKDIVTIDSVVDATEANGTWKVTSVADVDTFTFELDSMSSYTSGGNVTKQSMFYFEKGTVKGLVAWDEVKFYEKTTWTTEDVVVTYVDSSNDVVAFASVTSDLFTVDNDARISLVPKTVTPNETILFTTEQFRVRLGDTISEARTADPINIWTLTIENNRNAEVKNQTENNVVAPTGYEGKISFTRLFENVEVRDEFRQRKPQAMVVEIANDKIISSTDTNNQVYKIQIEIPKMIYETHELPLSANALMEETAGGVIMHDKDEGYSIRYIVRNDKDDTYYV